MTDKKKLSEGFSKAEIVPKSKGMDAIVTAESQRSIAEVQASITVAIHNPRSEAVAIDLMERAVGRLSFAQKAFYSFPRANKEIFGPSIYMAREFARYWGNIMHGFRIVYDEGQKRIVEGYAWDLQINTKVANQSAFDKLIQRKDFNTGRTVWKEPDERDLRELTAKHSAIQVRNCVLQILPRDIVDQLVLMARETVKKNISKKDIRPYRGEVIRGFESIGVSKEAIEKYIGCIIDKTTGEQLVELQGIFKAIRDGLAKKEEYFGTGTPKGKQPKKPEKPGPDKTKEPGEINFDRLKKAKVNTEGENGK